MADVKQILTVASDAQLAGELLKSYGEVVENFSLEKWKYAELDAGHFVESARRFIELKLFGKYTPIGQDLPKFNDSALQQYQNVITGDDSYRMIIPRVLYSMYTIRNKRGVGHVGKVSPNEMDAMFILSGTKWTLAELIRLNSNLPMSETGDVISRVVERRLDLLWKDGNTVRILDHKMLAPDKVLVHLYDKSPQARAELQAAIEYKNPSNFLTVLKGLHGTRHIDLSGDGTCRLTTKGSIRAEEIIKASGEKKESSRPAGKKRRR